MWKALRWGLDKEISKSKKIERLREAELGNRRELNGENRVKNKFTFYF